MKQAKTKLIGESKTRYLCVLLFLAVASSLSFAQAKEFIIGVEDIDYYPLYDFSINNRERESFTKELLSTFFRTHGYQFKFVALPIKRFDKWYEDDGIDFKYPDSPRWRNRITKKLDLTFSQPVLQLTAGSYVLKKNQNRSRNSVKRLGIMFGFFPTLWYDKLQNGTLEKFEAHSSFSLVKHLLHGNVDVIDADNNVINYNLKKLQKNEDEIVLNQHIKHVRYAHHFSTIKHVKIMQEFDDFMVNQSELVANIKKKYNIVEAPESL